MGGTGHLAGILRWSSGVHRGYCRSAQYSQHSHTTHHHHPDCRHQNPRSLKGPPNRGGFPSNPSVETAMAPLRLSVPK